MIYIKEIAANDVAYTDGGAQVEFPKRQFGALWAPGDVTISINYNKDGVQNSTEAILTIPDQGNFYAREYSRRNGNRSPLKEFFRDVLKLNQNDIGTLLIFEDKSGAGVEFDLHVYKPKSKKGRTMQLPQPIDFLSGNVGYIDALRTKPFLLLAGISGTGKSRIVRELAFKSCPSYLQDKDGTTPGNYCMIEVKPNWHDSSELLGYYSNISKKYIFTKFVKFLVRAMMHPTVPFFVCLDEMNLAPVEQYFAEFLSVLETRKKDGDMVISGVLVKPESFILSEEKVIGGMKVESKKIPTDKDWFNEFFEVEGLSDKEIEIVNKHTSQSLALKGLTLPENVFVIGTVNMDDTTHQFSRKVIDRAMTIEMNGGKLEDMFGGSKALEYLKDDKDVMTMDFLGAKYVSADDVLAHCGRVQNDEAIKFITGKDADGNVVSDEETLPKKLRDINEILKNTPFQVSYRVLNELVIYLAVLLDEDKEDKDIKELANAALDNIMLMKILPRIEGDYEMFNPNGEENKLVSLQKLFAEDTQSYKKLDEMIKRLESTEFTRFWP